MSRGPMADWECVIALAEDNHEIERGLRWAGARPDVQQVLDAAYALGGWKAGCDAWRGYDAERLAQGGTT